MGLIFSANGCNETGHRIGREHRSTTSRQPTESRITYLLKVKHGMVSMGVSEATSSGAKASMRLYALTSMVLQRVALMCEDDDLAYSSRNA
jgi:hypothetical protein